MNWRPLKSNKTTRFNAMVRSILFNSLFSGLLATSLVVTHHVAAEPEVKLHLPVDCQPGTDCWIFRYVDVDPGSPAVDYQCGELTGAGHKGVDFAIANQRVMRQGVAVLAAADGVVEGRRDGIPDRVFDPSTDAGSIQGQECGNGVRIRHAPGKFTLYCHMERGSVRVRRGQRVRQGDVLGMIGLSGETNYPHLHFTVLRHGNFVDPFTGADDRPGCEQTDGQPLWADSANRSMPYRPVQIYNLGFADHAPSRQAMRNGDYDGIAYRKDIQTLVLWAEVAGGREGDRLRFEITGPDGRMIFNAESRMPKTSIRQPVGRSWPLDGVALAAGTYKGRIAVKRGDLEVIRDITVAIR